jgi:hypothetical protein
MTNHVIKEQGSSMKTTIIMFVAGLLTQQIVQGQGTTYLSSLSPNSTGNVLVGSDSWLAAGFRTGPNPDGYLLDSVQLGMADATGNPSGFAAMLYSSTTVVGAFPKSSLGTLTGSLNPTTAGIYTYTPTSTLTLSPSTFYFVVLTGDTPVANGAYSWSESAYPPSVNDWVAFNGVMQSANGTSPWQSTPYLGMAQFQINATLVPEPGVLTLFALGGVFFLCRHWRRC